MDRPKPYLDIRCNSLNTKNVDTDQLKIGTSGTSVNLISYRSFVGSVTFEAAGNPIQSDVTVPLYFSDFRDENLVRNGILTLDFSAVTFTSDGSSGPLQSNTLPPQIPLPSTSPYTLIRAFVSSTYQLGLIRYDTSGFISIGLGVNGDNFNEVNGNVIGPNDATTIGFAL